MFRRRAAIPVLLVAAATLTSCGGTRIEPGPVDAVVLIVVDTLRGDRLSCHGYTGHRTPRMDALAARGARFADAQAVASWTIPSMGSLLTSLYPGQLGMVEKPEPVTRKRQRRTMHVAGIPPYETTLAELMRDGGFATAAFVDQPGLNTGRGFMRGFDAWYYPSRPGQVERLPADTVLPRRAWGDFLYYASDSDRALAAELDTWLAAHGEGKVFVWLHLLTPHMPYRPATGHGVDADEQDRATLYDGEVRVADTIVGDVLDSVERRLGWDRTLVVLTSDHGEAFGEHGSWEHGQSLHREVVHVPLILAAPGVPGGIAVPQRVRLLDVMPTILDVAGVEHDPAALQGASLVPLLAGAGEDRTVFGEGMLYGGTERSLVRDGRKLMLDALADTFLLYDPAADPGERDDLAAAEPRRARDMLSELEDRHRTLDEDRQRRLAAASPSDTVVTPAERARMREALKALGY